MNKFQFSLDRVLKIREIREQLARETVGRRQLELVDAAEHWDVLKTISDRVAAEERCRRLGSVVAGTLQTGQDHLADVRGQMDVASAQVDVATGELGQAQTAYIGRQAERKAISLLREKRSMEYWFALLREEQKLIDEMASRRASGEQGQPALAAAEGAAAGRTGSGGRR